MRVTDPVCGMDVDTESAAASRERNGLRYWFCSPACANHFDADPVVQAPPGRPAVPFRPADRVREAGIGRQRPDRRVMGHQTAGPVRSGLLETLDQLPP
jgi:Cu+-exporting ATPase